MDGPAWMGLVPLFSEAAEMAYLKALADGLEDPIVVIDQGRPDAGGDGTASVRVGAAGRRRYVDWYRSRAPALARGLARPAHPGFYTVLVVTCEGASWIELALTSE